MNKHIIYKWSKLLAGISILPISLSCLLGSSTKDDRINILFIMDDQHRGDCIGTAGAEWLTTPNLDRLAREGALFNKAYTSTPSCLPARAALLTGKSPWAHGMLVYTSIPEKYPYEKPRIFSESGYRTHAVGKMHYNTIRNKHGYETVFLEEGWHSVNKEQPKCDYQIWFEKVAPDKDMNATGLYYTDHRGGRWLPFADSLHPTYWTAQQAVNFLETYNEKRPWFLKISFQRPHPPFDPPKRWYDHYEGTNFPMPEVGSWAAKKYGDKKGSLDTMSNATSGNFPSGEIRKSRQSYYAAISFVDEQIGHILAVLEKRGELENTLILFTSDHGDMMGDQFMWRKCRPYDPSARIPMIIRWPESLGIKAERGQIRKELVELRDVLPTFLDGAGMEKPHEMDGRSMLDILRGANDWRKILDLEHGLIYEPDNAWTCLTDGKYKYIYFTLTGEQQLFDLENDPNELNNLATVPAFAGLLKTWRKNMVVHLAIRGEPWVGNNDLLIQEYQVKFSPNYPGFKEDGK